MFSDCAEVHKAIESFGQDVGVLERTCDAHDAERLCLTSRRIWTLLLPALADGVVDRSVTGQRFLELLQRAKSAIENVGQPDDFTRQYAVNVERRANAFDAYLKGDVQRFRRILRDVIDAATSAY
jgi:hypothetical protein